MARYFMSGTPLAALERELMTPPGSGCRRVEREPDIRRGYSRRQVEEMGFPIQKYKFPRGKGAFVGELVMKKWGKRNSLICYFDARDGNSYKLCVWFNCKDERSYRPLRSKLDISMVQIGTVLRVEYDEAASGKTKWLTAEVTQ